MLKVILIRHSKTEGNLLGRYIGVTDEPLCPEGICLLQESVYPEDVEQVYVSPMKRCIETASIIYPRSIQKTVEDLRECNFGDFENKNYKELSGNPDYQAWIDSGGSMQIPHGEAHEAFKKRCVKAFGEILADAKERGLTSVAVVAHGGTLMSILEACAVPCEEFYHWQVKNGRGYVTRVREDGSLEILSKLPQLPRS